MSFSDIRKIFPIQGIEQDFLVAGNGDVTCGWEVCLPEIFSLDIERYNQLYDSFLSAFLKLPSQTVVHLQNIYYHGDYDKEMEANSFCLRENQKVFLGRPVLHHTSRIYLTFTNKTLNKVTAEHHPVIKMWDYLASRPFKDCGTTISTALMHQELFSSSLASINGVESMAMDNDALKSALWDYWNIAYDHPGGYKKGMSLPPVGVEKGFLRIGGRFVGVVSMINQGEQVSLAKKHRTIKALSSDVSMEQEFQLLLGSVFPISIGLPVNHIVNTVFTIQDKERMYVDFFKRTLSEGILSGFGYDPSIKKVQAIRDFKDAVSNRDLTLCKAAVNAIITDKDLDSLHHSLRHTTTAFDGINECHSWIENQETLNLFVGSSPGFGRGNYRTFDTVVEHALCYMPMETHYISDPEGNLYIDRFGNPVIVDLWNPPHIQNRNIVVEGGSGTGKSFWINGLVDEDLARGTHIIILDVGHSYRDLCMFNKGLYIDSSARERLSFNIFLTDKDENGRWNLTPEKRLFIHSVLLAMWQGTKRSTMEIHSILNDLIEKFYYYINEHSIFPVFEEFFQFIDIYEQEFFKASRAKFFDFESLRTVFEAYASGEYKFLLNNPEQWQLRDEQFIVFDIEHIENDKIVFPVVGLIIMELVMDKIRSLGGCRKRFIIDEGWKVLRGELREFVEYLYRTFRKHEGSILLATQDINDFEQVACADAMLSNSDTVVLMRRAARKNYGDLQRWLSLTDFEIDLMRDMKKREAYREFFIKQGDHARIFRYEVSEKTHAIYSSKGKDKAEIQENFKKHGNLGLAVNQFIENKYKKEA